MPDDSKIRTILLVEDDDAHLELILASFERSSESYRLMAAKSIAEARPLIKAGGMELMISDYKLPDGLGEELILAAEGAFPVIIMTSQGSEHLAVEMLKIGALDYIVKSPQMFMEMPHIAARAIDEWRHINEKNRAAEALIKNAESYRILIETSGDVLMKFDKDYKISYASGTIGKYFDGGPAALAGKSIDETGFHSKITDFLKSNIKEVLQTKKNVEAELEVFLEQVNETIIFEFRFFAELDISGQAISVICVARDITGRKRYEEELKKGARRSRGRKRRKNHVFSQYEP